MRLKVNYENVRARAQEISNTIADLNAKKQVLINTSNNLQNAWHGEAADAFKVKLDELIKELDSAVKEMANILREILVVAESIKKADERLADSLNNTSNANVRGGGGYGAFGSGGGGGGFR
ncbi:WXG100 family type VII secretion target [Phascolarctobacterium succinatutens]|uniref:WXG100 family type VII secretion target n=1 Tax=Phascolarctobacterium succinatutens TaxID=626940 RepID=UPI003A8CBCCE